MISYNGDMEKSVREVTQKSIKMQLTVERVHCTNVVITQDEGAVYSLVVREHDRGGDMGMSETKAMAQLMNSHSIEVHRS